MDTPEELRQAVIEAIRQADYECEMAESVQMPFASWTDHQADAVLAVPVIADALRAAERDAKVAEIVAELSEPNPSTGHIIRCANACGDIAALYQAAP